MSLGGYRGAILLKNIAVLPYTAETELIESVRSLHR